MENQSNLGTLINGGGKYELKNRMIADSVDTAMNDRLLEKNKEVDDIYKRNMERIRNLDSLEVMDKAYEETELFKVDKLLEKLNKKLDKFS